MNVPERPRIEDSNIGLYYKYNVYRVSDCSRVDNCFVLRPEKDPAAVQAILAYTEVTKNQKLAEDLINWLYKIDPSIVDTGVSVVRRNDEIRRRS